MRMRSVSGKDVYVTSEDGMHSDYIGKDYKEVHPRLVQRALMSGCTPEAFDEKFYEQEVLAKQAKTMADRSSVIREKVELMFQNNFEGDITAAGFPNLKKLSTYVGFEVSREEMVEAVSAAGIAIAPRSK